MTVAYTSSQIYIAYIRTVKNYVMVMDACKGVQLLYWREEDATFNLLAKDFDASVTVNSSFLIDGDKLGLVVSDAEGNVKVLQYNPR